MVENIKQGLRVMKKVLLIDYYGTCDQNGKAIGHSPKVLEEYGELLRGEYEVSAAVSPCLLNEAAGEKIQNFHKIYSLKYNIITEGMESLGKRIKDKLKLFYNLYQVFKIDDHDILWFYRTDFFLALFFCFFLSKKRKKGDHPKIVVLLYQNSFGENTLGRILDRIYHAGFKKADGIISTQKGFKDLGIPALYIPDYYYDAQKYEKYRRMEKQDKAVCVGTMSPYKQLGPLVEAFNRNGLPLEIRGFFFDKEQYRLLLRNKKENILIEDIILTEEEYYQTLAGAKYSILPYDMEQYQCRTSGVLQECVFLDIIPVAPNLLLKQNHIPGIGYHTMDELKDRNFFEQNMQWDAVCKVLRDECDLEKVRQSLVQFLERLF